MKVFIFSRLLVVAVAYLAFVDSAPSDSGSSLDKREDPNASTELGEGKRLWRSLTAPAHPDKPIANLTQYGMTVGSHVPPGSAWEQGHAPNSPEITMLGLTTSPGWNTMHAAGGTSLAPTASFVNIISATQGAIIEIENNPRGCRYTWEDVTFAMWARECHRTAVNPNTLKWIVRRHIDTDETVNVMKDVGGEGTYHRSVNSWEMGGWDIYKDIDGNNPFGKFLRLLGTAEGLSVGLLLQEHRWALGMKRLESIQLVQDDLGVYSMIFAFDT